MGERERSKKEVKRHSKTLKDRSVKEWSGE